MFKFEYGYDNVFAIIFGNYYNVGGQIRHSTLLYELTCQRRLFPFLSRFKEAFNESCLQ